MNLVEEQEQDQDEDEHDDDQQTNILHDDQSNTIIIHNGNQFLSSILGHRIPTTAQNGSKLENVSLEDVDTLLATDISTENTPACSQSPSLSFCRSRSHSAEQYLDCTNIENTQKLTLASMNKRPGHEKISTIIITQYSTDSEVMLVAPQHQKQQFFIAHPVNDPSFDVHTDFTNCNDPKYFVDSAAALHGFAPSVEIHYNLANDITFGLPIERLPKELRCSSIESLDANFVLEPAYFENMSLYENNSEGNDTSSSNMLSFDVSSCCVSQTIVIEDVFASCANGNANKRNASIGHGFSTSMQMSIMNLNQSFQWTKPGLPIDHVALHKKSMDLLTTTYSKMSIGSKSRSVSHSSSGSLTVEITNRSMNTEHFLLWQIQGRRLRKMTNKQLIEWLQKSNFDQSVISCFSKLRIDGNKLWKNIRNASMFLNNVGVMRPTLRDAIVQNIYLNLLPKTPGFDERHIIQFKNLRLIAHGPISTVYTAVIKRKNLGLRQSTVVIKGYHFTADEVRVGKIVQILVHLVNNISSEFFVKIHGFIRNMQDYESHLSPDGNSDPNEETDDESDSEPEAEEKSSIVNKNATAVKFQNEISVRAESAMFGIVMEYVNDGSIRSLYDLKNGMKRFNSMDKIGIIIDIASAICYSLHDKGYIHRNLKASNVLIKSDDSVKLTDYCMDVTQITDVAFGKQQSERSLRWMAPELLRSANIEYSKKSDVYSFGITMYEILSGHRPYHKHKQPELLIGQILNGLRPNLDDIVLYPEPLLDLMKRCWSETIADRPDFLTIVETLVDIRDNERDTKKTFDDYVNAFQRMRNSRNVPTKGYQSSPLLLSSNDPHEKIARKLFGFEFGENYDNDSKDDTQIMSLFSETDASNNLIVHHRHARDDSALELELKPKKFKPGKRRPRKPLPSAPPKKALPSMHTGTLVINNATVVIPDKPLPQPAALY